MAVSYKKLWHLLLDKDMNKQDLMRVSKISSSSVAKLSKGVNVSMDTLARICNALECNVSDIMEITPDKREDKANAE
ncbi:MAG: helix-turn-helix transcriptional regulator [Clostridiales bacterium]|jgi:DNA-binding Xre family transcriptional regulator|nr:helix-turn-helix transcriptional regulator [Clostridiales bacterium]